MYFASKDEMIKERYELSLEKMKLDKFFSLFLDKYGSKMDPEKPDTNIWKLYKTKFKEYAELDTRIKTLEYRIQKI
jgi:hypothetical protein